MQLPFRATNRLQPAKNETIVRTREQAYDILKTLDERLSHKMPKHQRAEALIARAIMYAALGSHIMLDSAWDAYKFSKTSQTAMLLGAALHHHGATRKALKYYEEAYKLPHERGYEVDVAYVGTLLHQNRWDEAWKLQDTVKKRMVVAGRLVDWKGDTVDKLSVVNEGGFGDVIQFSRYLPMLVERGIDVTVYLHEYFFKSGFVDLARRQPWFPPIKPLIETPQFTPAVGFFDLPARFRTDPDTIPATPIWEVDETIPENAVYSDKIGFCWGARAVESPICEAGVYRSLTEEQAERIVHAGKGWMVNLQKGGKSPSPMMEPSLDSWEATASVIAELDLVITVDTSIMHLAASMGKPVWVLLSGATEWKFGLEGSTTPWYPTVRLFRNNGFGLESSVNNVIEALKGLNGQQH